MSPSKTFKIRLAAGHNMHEGFRTQAEEQSGLDIIYSPFCEIFSRRKTIVYVADGKIKNVFRQF